MMRADYDSSVGLWGTTVMIRMDNDFDAASITRTSTRDFFHLDIDGGVDSLSPSLINEAARHGFRVEGFPADDQVRFVRIGGVGAGDELEQMDDGSLLREHEWETSLYRRDR